MQSLGGDLFIVDNSISGWTGIKYLEQWTEISTSFDIATGYFDAGALLALDSHWQKLNKVRILMGDETTQKTKKLLLEAVTRRAARALDEDLEYVKDENPFLNGLEAVIESIVSGKIECRVYNKTKFHAKAYITHPVLSGNSVKKLQESVIKKVIVCDTIKLKESQKFQKLEIVSTSNVFSESIKRIDSGESLSSMFKI
mgnify:CR=1 FL=1